MLGRVAENSPMWCVKGKTFAIWFVQGIYIQSPKLGVTCPGKYVSQLPVLSPWISVLPVHSPLLTMLQLDCSASKPGIVRAE